MIREHTTLADALAQLANVSGALADAGVVVPGNPWLYGDAIRSIVVDRDALRVERDDLRDRLDPCCWPHRADKSVHHSQCPRATDADKAAVRR